MLKEIIVTKDFKVEKLNKFNLIRAGYFSTILLNEIYSQNNKTPIFYRKIDCSKQINFKTLLQNIWNQNIKEGIAKFNNYEEYNKILFSLIKMTTQIKENNILLIDGIENGLSFNDLLLIFPRLFSLNCQVFVTTYNPLITTIFLKISEKCNKKSECTYFDLKIETKKIKVDIYPVDQLNSEQLNSFFHNI